MGTTQAMTKPKDDSLLTKMAQQYSLDRVQMAETLKKTIFPSGQATNEQLAAFVAVAHQYQLNPFLKEIYAFPTKGGGIMPVVSIDGWIKIINRHPQFDCMSIQETIADDGKPIFTTCTIRRKDRSEPTTVAEHFAECKRNTEPWNQMPNRMLRHKAVIQCARYAFGFSGIQDEDEALDSVQRSDAEARPAIPAVQRRTVAAVPSPATIPAAVVANPDADPEPEPQGIRLDFDKEEF
jgi:phage recombination protein Bet